MCVKWKSDIFIIFGIESIHNEKAAFVAPLQLSFYLDRP
jgi:hypothetical protein